MKTKTIHISKAITWRILASLTTFALAWFFFKDDPNATQKATSVALSELVLKLVFYYYHERLWHKVKADDKDR